MHSVEHLPWHLTFADAEEVWQVLAPPRVRERPRVDRQTALLCDSGHFPGNSAAPIDHGPEDVEGEHLEIRFGRHADLLTLRQLEVGAVDRVFGMSQDVQQPRVHGNEDAADLGSSLFYGLSPRLTISGHLDSSPLGLWANNLVALRHADHASTARQVL